MIPASLIIFNRSDVRLHTPPSSIFFYVRVGIYRMASDIRPVDHFRICCFCAYQRRVAKYPYTFIAVRKRSVSAVSKIRRPVLHVSVPVDDGTIAFDSNKIFVYDLIV